MDFIRVGCKENKDGTREFYPSLQALESQDLVVRGSGFVAIWDEDTKLYSRRTSHLPAIIDRAFAKMVGDQFRPGDTIRLVRNFDNQIFNKLLSLIRSIGDMGPELDQKIIYADQEPTKADAATFKMPYSLSDAPCPTWDRVVGTLYDEENRLKIEWAIGSILSGEAAINIQKFYVFFGPPGSGKSTIMDVIEKIFGGHTSTFSAYDLGRADQGFPLEPFMKNPLVAIDQDGDLSRIEMNVLLNKITAHDKVNINAKGKSLFEIIPRSTLFVGSNDPVKITNRKSGLFRRVVDIQPSGQRFNETEYHRLVSQMNFELGSIAYRCLQVFNDHGSEYLSSYRAMDMMYRTNDIFNFVEDNRLILSQGLSLKQAHNMWNEWCIETETRNHYKRFQFRDLLKDYYKEFHEEVMIEGVRHRSWFAGLKDLEKFSWKGSAPVPPKSWLELDVLNSIFDESMADAPAQEATSSGTPKRAWENVETTLSDIDTAVEHFVKVPEKHIVIDFDLKDDDGNKSLDLCLEAAAKWPPTYAEVSRSGDGLHLHYDYSGDVERLAGADPDGGFEVKTLLGGASLRRRLTLCNLLPVASISTGLPVKDAKVLPENYKFKETTLRAQILKALRKGVHAGTKSNMDYIKMITDEAALSGEQYDVSDMWDDIFQFAMGSSNQKSKCLEIAMSLQLVGDYEIEAVDDNEKPIAYFDCEVFPNLFMIGYMLDKDDAEVVVMINPSPQEVQWLFDNLRLIGWYNRPYDNHILWAASLGATNAELYDRSQRMIVEGDRRATFGAAYNVAYADGYDVASNANMKSLKKWQIDLGLPHLENDHPWDQPVPDEKIMDITEYLISDVKSTRIVLKHIDGDMRAREILAQISGLAVCNTNRQHTEKLIFGKAVKEGHSELKYTDLREMFPGYEFDQFKPGKEKSTYKGVQVGEGGWVKSLPGMYENVAVYDVASMHPSSIIALNMFGKYTPKFKELLDLRLMIKKAIKTGEFADIYAALPEASNFLKNTADAKALSDALKIVVNSVYGLTAASFPNTFKDSRNIDNIVAKRGALFMVDLVEAVEKAGFKVVHVKTDSIKVPDATPELFALVSEFGAQYGYDFEHEATYDRFCLVNDAVYVAREGDEWSFVGKQFQHPVVNKTLFTHEELAPRDYIEVKQVSKGAMYLATVDTEIRQFVGKFGAFVPVMGGRQLVCINGDKVNAVAGSKDWLWETDETAFGQELEVDYSYFQDLIDAARKQIEKYGSYEHFVRP